MALHAGFGFALALAPIVLAAPAFAGNGSRELDEFLARWGSRTAEVMDESLPRWDENGAPIRPGLPEERRFPPGAIESGKALDARDRVRSEMCMEWKGEARCLGDRLGERARIEGSDRPEALVDNGAMGMVRNLKELERLGVQRGRIPEQPWSGDFWAHDHGGIGARYRDPGFPVGRWRDNLQYILEQSAGDIAESGSSSEFHALSPAEKYDLLVGDSAFSLTRAMWDLGRGYYEEEGAVEPWLGICHGWAPASMMAPRPRQTVKVRSFDGRRVLNFYPSDLKALASLLWADGDFRRRFVGGRCLDREPKKDPNGRILSEDCFDTNPGTWHLALTNQIGIMRRSLLFDASYDDEVWNYPILGYSYSYFNPRTLRSVEDLAQARVSAGEFDDRFRRYRSEAARYVVGVAMEVTYVATRAPLLAATDSKNLDRVRKVRYVYDLELDDSGSVLGGEWYTNRHPDFLWVPEPGAQAVSAVEDRATGEWDGMSRLPESWKNAAAGATFSGLPLAKIVLALMKRSAATESGPR